ncbi:MAG TPA: type II toxin-antitoxin system RelE/ParE family toxin [Ktedonobacteraceae bacterium]
MQFSVRFYHDVDGNKPLLAFLEDLRTRDRILHKLVVARIRKLEEGERHGSPLTALVDQHEVLFELHIGGKNIARVFFFFGQGQELILTHGYIKKQQKVDARELERARSYKKDWEQRHL